MACRSSRSTSRVRSSSSSGRCPAVSPASTTRSSTRTRPRCSSATPRRRCRRSSPSSRRCSDPHKLVDVRLCANYPSGRVPLIDRRSAMTDAAKLLLTAVLAVALAGALLGPPPAAPHRRPAAALAVAGCSVYVLALLVALGGHGGLRTPPVGPGAALLALAGWLARGSPRGG